MRRLIGVCLVLLCLLVTLPASATVGTTLTASLIELASRWWVSYVVDEDGGADPLANPLEVGSTMDPDG